MKTLCKVHKWQNGHPCGVWLMVVLFPPLPPTPPPSTPTTSTPPRRPLFCPRYPRSVEQAIAGAHVSGSPFRILVTPGEVSGNGSVAYGSGLTSWVAGGMFGSPTFTIRSDALPHRLRHTGLLLAGVYDWGLSLRVWKESMSETSRKIKKY